MTREEITQNVLASNAKDYVLELSTGVGKSKITLEKLNQWFKDKKDYKILIVLPKRVLVKNWQEEINTWGYNYLLQYITFSCYASFHKYIGSWDAVVFDEAHHISERCRSFLPQYKIEHSILLSATLRREFKQWIRYNYKDVLHLSVSAQTAIDSDILPEPKIILLPLSLDHLTPNCVYPVKAKKGGSKIAVDVLYKDRWKYKKYIGAYNLLCTQRQYYNEISSLIEWYKQKGSYSVAMKNVWLHKCNDRLKWLSDQKTFLIKQILSVLKNYRTLTFCGTIGQSEKLEKPCINSKIGTENLDKFNAKKIKHICAVNILDEGCNLTSCKIGLFQMINSSTIKVTQRIGRILRHKTPILIFPYYRYTREEEIINNIIADYDKNSIITLDSIGKLTKLV